MLAVGPWTLYMEPGHIAVVNTPENTQELGHSALFAYRECFTVVLVLPGRVGISSYFSSPQLA